MLSVPNLLTFLRISLIPVFIYFFIIGEFLISGLIFTFSALTDFLDGYLARKYNLTSQLGRTLDPLADKLTVISILLALTIMKIIPDFIAIIILTRELIILFSSGIAYLIGINVINPTNLGKLSIFLLYTAIAAKLLNVHYVDMALFYIVIPLNIISGIDYILRAYQKINT